MHRVENGRKHSSQKSWDQGFRAENDLKEYGMEVMGHLLPSKAANSILGNL